MIHEHQLERSDKKGYLKCSFCGTYISNQLQGREELYLDDYWNQKHNRNTIDQQVANLLDTHDGRSKVGMVLSYMDKKGKVLELACAPAILMRVLAKRGFDVTGVEPDAKNIPDIKRISANLGKVVEGFFPDISDQLEPPYDYVIAMDLCEHIPAYEDFLAAIASIISPGGKLIFISPIIYEDGLFRPIDFIPLEHAVIATKKYLDELLPTLFSSILYDRLQVGHETVICTK